MLVAAQPLAPRASTGADDRDLGHAAQLVEAGQLVGRSEVVEQAERVGVGSTGQLGGDGRCDG